MCYQPGQQVDDHPGCIDMKNATDGVRTFLQFLDPSIDKVGLALTPPLSTRAGSRLCKTPDGYLPWTGTSNPNAPPSPSANGKFYGSGCVLAIVDPEPRQHAVAVHGGLARGCGRFRGRRLPRQRSGSRLDPQSGVRDHPAPGLRGRRRKHELRTGHRRGTARSFDRNGRGNVQDVIVFLGDGAANSSPMNLATGHWTDNPTNQQRPCGTTVQSAQRVKDQGTVVYTIGYDLNGAGTDLRALPQAGCKRSPAGEHAGELRGVSSCVGMQCVRRDPRDGDRRLCTSTTSRLQASLNDIFTGRSRSISPDRADGSSTTPPPISSAPETETTEAMQGDATAMRNVRAITGRRRARERAGARRAGARSCRSSCCCCSASCSSERVFRDYVALTDATRVGARQASVARSLSGTDAFRDDRRSINVTKNAGVEPRPEQDDGHRRRRCKVDGITAGWEGGGQVTVRATYPFKIDIMGMVMFNGTLKSRSVERVE